MRKDKSSAFDNDLGNSKKSRKRGIGPVLAGTRRKAGGVLGTSMQKYLARGLAKGVVRRIFLLKMAGIVMAVSATGLAVTYAVATALDENERFTITVDYEDYVKKGISLSTSPDFSDSRDMLYAQRVDDLTNIAYDRTIEPYLDEIKETEGAYNDVNYDYIAFTFYLKNTGTVPVAYQESLTILQVLKNTDDAVRTLMIRNDVATMYAKLSVDTTPEPVSYSCVDESCEFTTPFYSTTEILNNKYEQFQVDEVVKYTIVVWLEGNDPECLDNLKGGGIRMAFDFKIVD